MMYYLSDSSTDTAPGGSHDNLIGLTSDVIHGYDNLNIRDDDGSEDVDEDKDYEAISTIVTRP